MTRARGMMRQAGIALALASVAGCAGGRAVRDTPAAQALPEPDPACRGTAQQRMLAYGLEQVVVKVSIDRRGNADVLEFVAPYVSPAAAEEIRAALQGCPWAPRAEGPGGAYVVTVPVRSR